MNVAPGGIKELVLLTRADCHLCAAARDIVELAVGRVGPQVARWQEIDVDSQAELRGEYGDLVPVVLIDGECHGYYEFDAGRLERSLLGS